MQNKRQDYHYLINENSCVIALCVFPLLFHANCLSDFHRGIASNDSTHHFTDSGCPNLQPLAIPTAIAGGEGRNRTSICIVLKPSQLPAVQASALVPQFYKVLLRVLWLQELFWKDVLLFANHPRTIAVLLFYWSYHWRLLSTRNQRFPNEGRATKEVALTF
jgi:hypothetical protein